MLIGGPSPPSCCGASYADAAPRKATSFAGRNRVKVGPFQGGKTMILRILGMLAAACLAFAGAAQAQTAGKTELLWYSQAAFKITTPGGKVIMIDPWIMGATKIPPDLKDLSK